MAKFVVEILKSKERAQIDNLPFLHKFSDYRTYRIINKDRLNAYLSNQILKLHKDRNSWVVVAREGGKIVGFASLTYLLWDAKHFGFKMGKIGYLAAEGNYERAVAIKNKLLAYLFKLCKKEKIVHLSCRIDVSDTSGIHSLEVNDFRLMDTLVTYVFNRYKHNICGTKDLYRIRAFRKEDLGQLIHIAASTFTKDRFHLDPLIPGAKANVLFGEWIKNYCKNKTSNKVLVAEDNKKSPVGFLAYKLDRELEKLTGIKIIGRGLSASLPESKGAYVALVKAVIQDTVKSYDCAEFDTQLNNYQVIKVWGRFKFDFTGAKYTFHKWFKESP